METNQSFNYENRISHIPLVNCSPDSYSFNRERDIFELSAKIQGHTYMFRFKEDEKAIICRSIGVVAANPEMGFDWPHAAKCIKMISDYLPKKK